MFLNLESSGMHNCSWQIRASLHTLVRQTKTFACTECSNPCSQFDAWKYCNFGTMFGSSKPLQCMLQRVCSHSSKTISDLMSNLHLCMHPLVVSNKEFAFYYSSPVVHLLRVCDLCSAQVFEHSVSSIVYTEYPEIDRNWVCRSYSNATKNWYRVTV